ncbi:bifunctional diaminohydroxyphosphoribosylaminopyrimidine deaminase/5-amino-6-(5-phosphoribosylamino)uracil reductase RibD [bacterium]|nr:bifunctional diaminohydroxyphosphoribosylaminopyrimidine deaminase/5-amino-6-(5-phosphoribosylamino)uracil reductase RibD [bacterium]
MNNQKDISYLYMAYGLAEKAKGWTSPNPYVGAVVVQKDTIVGTGYHEQPGKPHAEAIALQKAGNLSQNSTLYLTLEPCVHWGRTPPCIDKILRSGLKRVVVSSLDPNPAVYTRGITQMREAGIDVSVGLLDEKNRSLNEIYWKYITRKIPFIISKVALSLDGKIATRTFSSQWISSSQTREYVHLLRGECDAIMVGINTLLQDDPLLTVRHPHWEGKRITRVIVDSNLRFPTYARILSTIPQGDIWVFTLKDPGSPKARSLKHKGVKIISTAPSSSRGVDLKEVFNRLGKQEISSVFVEGGGHLLTSLLEEKLIDKIFVNISPKLIGGEKAPGFFGGQGVKQVKDSLQLKKIRSFHIQDDIMVEGYF